MIYSEERGAGGHQSTVSGESTPTLGVSISVDYWVLEKAGGLADPARTASLPGADCTDSPYSIAIETPVCEHCGELRAALLGQLRSVLTAAAERDCRLLAVGVRPDQSDGGTQDGPPPETAGVRVRFETDPSTATTVYNLLLALDPAFVLLEPTRGDRSPSTPRRTVLVSGSTPVAAGYRVARPLPADVAVPRQSAEGATHWQPVRLVDERTVEWRSLTSSTPTLLIDLIADVLSILRKAIDCRIEVGSFGNGFEIGCLSLPTVAWRQRYLDDALTEGLASLRLRAYLERFGFDTNWYLHAQPPAVAAVDHDRRARCRQQAALLAADA